MDILKEKDILLVDIPLLRPSILTLFAPQPSLIVLYNFSERILGFHIFRWLHHSFSCIVKADF